MPAFTFDKVLKIISTILTVLQFALGLLTGEKVQSEEGIAALLGIGGTLHRSCPISRLLPMQCIFIDESESGDPRARALRILRVRATISVFARTRPLRGSVSRPSKKI